MTTVNMHDAKTQLSKLVEAAQRGETIIIARHGQPAAQLTALTEPEQRWSPQALAYFASAPNPALADFDVPRDDVLPLTDPELY